METPRPLFVLLLFVVSGCLCGEICYEDDGYTVDSFYCSTGCCGSSSDRYCCWSAGSIVGVVVGIFIFLVIIGAAVVCCYQVYQRKQQNKVRRINNNSPQVDRVTFIQTSGPGYAPSQPPPYHGYGAPGYGPAFPPPAYAAPRGAEPWVPLSAMPYNEGPPPPPPPPPGAAWNGDNRGTEATNSYPPPTRSSRVGGATSSQAPPPPPPAAQPSDPRTNPFRFNTLPPLPPVTANTTINDRSGL